jgi:hypothetical protein
MPQAPLCAAVAQVPCCAQEALALCRGARHRAVGCDICLAGSEADGSSNRDRNALAAILTRTLALGVRST